MSRLAIDLPRAQIGATRWRRFRASVDWPLVITVVAIAAIGLFNLYSATHGTRYHRKFDSQVKWMSIGVVVFAAFTMIDYRSLVRLAWLALAGGVGLLLVVELVGVITKGSSRWIDVGSFRVQPSEPAKIAIILVLARMLQESEHHKPSPRQVALRLGALAVPIGMVGLQPDLGTATLMTLIAVSVGYLCVVNLWPMLHGTLIGLLAIPILWETMHGYQKDRILAFLDPSADPTGNGWHTQQSIFAVGSGQLWGKGYQEGTQNQFDFLPEHWTDFPFSVWAEEWGFAGSLVVLVLYLFLILWILGVGLSARDRAGTVICVGVAAMIFWHAAVNIAMVLGLAPVVGITLPLVSYGGASVLTFLAALGMVASVSLRKHGY
ncbi:MAG: rod shape-determining protein RodA [Kofleriaceae bacterium]|nr:rod shape-determining protein RodA [Kofleriaceae bacterium]